MKKVYYITHPDVLLDPSIPPPRWPLSERGRQRMERLLAQAWTADLGAVYCSAEQKALDGAGILCRALGLPCQVVEELGEIDRSATGFLTLPELEPVVEQFFAHPQLSSRGWETAQAAQQRISAAIESLVQADAQARDIAVVAHGTVGALYLCRLIGAPINRAALQPGSNGGHYFCFAAADFALLHGWEPIDPEPPAA